MHNTLSTPLSKIESSCSASQRRGMRIEQQDGESIIEQNQTSSVELVKNRTCVLVSLH